MKRFGTAVLDPRHVRAVSPVTGERKHGVAAALEAIPSYRVLFRDGNSIDLDRESAVALMAFLVPPVPVDPQ